MDEIENKQKNREKCNEIHQQLHRLYKVYSTAFDELLQIDRLIQSYQSQLIMPTFHGEIPPFDETEAYNDVVNKYEELCQTIKLETRLAVMGVNKN
jgi:hypothetical protein